MYFSSRGGEWECGVGLASESDAGEANSSETYTRFLSHSVLVRKDGIYLRNII